MSRPESTPPSSEQAGESTDEPLEQAQLQARIDILRQENERLRQESVRARKTSYRRTAIGLASIGVLAILGSALFAPVRSTLLIIGAIGLFSGFLVYYLTPERFIAAETGERIISAMDSSVRDLATSLDLSEQRLLVPTTDATTARLFVPRYRETSLQQDALPPRSALADPFVTDSDGAQGLSLHPAGERLYQALEAQAIDASQSTPRARVAYLGDALVEQFELAGDVAIDSEAATGELTLRITDPVYELADAFEHPLASFVGVGLAVHLDCPTEITTEATDGDLIIQLVWEAEESDPSAA